MNSGRTFSARAVEAVVIVASILFAFAVDAWWDGRAEEERRSAILSSLRTDMALARADLDRVLGETVTSNTAAADLMTLLDDTPIPDSLRLRADTLFIQVFGAGSFDPALGTVEALLSSGELSILDDRVLISELTTWPGRVADMNREHAFYRELILEILRDLDDRGVGVDIGWVNGATTDGEPVWTARPPGVSDYLDDPVGRGRVSFMWAMTRNLAADLRGFDESLDRIEGALAGG